jgi:hypothetical protein
VYRTHFGKCPICSILPIWMHCFVLDEIQYILASFTRPCCCLTQKKMTSQRKRKAHDEAEGVKKPVKRHKVDSSQETIVESAGDTFQEAVEELVVDSCQQSINDSAMRVRVRVRRSQGERFT